MKIIEDKEKMIFRNEKDDKIFYSLGLSKKNKDGSYENGFIQVKFRKDIDLKDKTKIIIKEAWLDFYKKDKTTVPYIFINDFEMASELDSIKQVADDDNIPFY